jgi:hypothetical protein
MASHVGTASVTDACRYKCTHYDCTMERGEVLPNHVTAWWPDGRRYEPDTTAQSLHDAIHWARFCHMWTVILEG